MTLLDQQTDLLPPRSYAEPDEPVNPRRGMLIAVLAVVLLALATTVVATAEVIFRAESQRAIAAELRTTLALPESQRIDVDIAGPVLLQQIVGRFHRVGVTIYSFTTGRANADLTAIAEGVHPADGEWTADRLSGALTLSAAQASALFLPAEAQGAMRVGFSGDEMTLDASMQGGSSAQQVRVAVTPNFDNGRLSAGIVSVTASGKIVSAEEIAAQTGVDLAAIQPAPVCLVEDLPRFLRVQDVRVSDQHLRIEFDVDLPASDTPAGRELGSCA